MTKAEIKQNIHSLVDEIDNDSILEYIRDIVKDLAEDVKLTWTSLSETERKYIEEGLEDLKNGRTIDYEDLKAKYPEWFGR